MAQNASTSSYAPVVETEAGEGEDSLLKISAKHKLAAANLMRLLSYTTLWDRIILGISCFAAIGRGLTMPFMYILFGSMIDNFTEYAKLGQMNTEQDFMGVIDQYALYIVFVFIARLVLSYVANLGFRMTSLRISAEVRLVYLQSLFSLPISTLDVLPPGQTASIITSVASTLQLGISDKLSQFFSGVAAILGSLVIALFSNWLLTFATSMGLVFIVAIYGLTTPRIGKILTRVMEMDMLAASVATEALTSIRMLAACGAESKMLDQHAKLVDEGRERGKDMATLVALQQGLVYLGVYATFALSFWAAFKLYMLVAISSPDPLLVVLLSVMLIAVTVTQVTAPLSAAQQAADAVGIFHTIIDAAPPSVIAEYGAIQAEESHLAEGDIVLENVNFTYSTRPNVKVLDGLNLRFQAGKMTAIVGPSGSGKSTIVGILERWYEFDGHPETKPLVYFFRNGIVSICGKELREIDVKWWRNQIGLVQQDNVLFATTIYQNIEYGLVGTKWENADSDTKERMIKTACREAFADEFISRLPKGYQTMVGEHGINLSGGQRQRLAIARAIVKQPKILILDEATSAIDVRSEQIVQAALDRASKGRTTIVIAHRLGTIRKADKIVVLRAGRVIQEGTHQSLMAEVGSTYHALSQAQNIGVGVEEDDAASIESTSMKEEVIGDDEKDLARFSSQGGDSEAPKPKTEEYHSRNSSDSIDEGPIRVIGQPSAVGDYGSIWTLLIEQSSRWKVYILVVIGSLGIGASTPLQAYLFAALISLFSIWETYLPLLVNFWCIMFMYLAIGVGLSQVALGWSTTTLGFAITRVYRKEYLSNILSQPTSFFDEEDHSVGALVGRLATDPTQLQQLVGVNLAYMLMSWFNLAGCLLISFIFGWKLTLVALMTSLPIVVGAMFYRVRYEKEFDAMSNAVFTESAKFACESIAAFRTVSSLTLEAHTWNRYEKLLRDHVTQAFRTARVSVLLYSLSDSVSLLCMAFILWYGSRLLVSQEYTAFQYMIVYIAVVQGGMSAGQTLSFGPNITSATAAADRILSTREEDSLHAGGSVPEVDNEKGVEVEFQDIWFEYPTRPVPVLKGLNLKIAAGQFAAIVGPSGSGKTTVISLLERFYSPDKGQVLCNGVDIKTLDLTLYRQGLSLVAQEPSLFSGSVRHNITLGLAEGTAAPEADIHKAVGDAGLEQFVASLPQGYDTPVGPYGLALSGGQKQRVSLARALIRKPALLLLDEATSSLDSETERQVQEAINAAKGTRTMVVVAHRLATVQNADVIFVMADGAVVETGDHASLLAKRGVYYQMCQSQALDR
ncbi:ABC transporter [Thozetella sp. PMI_491]|nr:ABC transporter [Thozetella sp. PMI_491]